MSDTSVTRLLGGCHCGAISYELPLPPVVDLESPDTSELYKNIMVAPSRQRFPERGGRNKWRACHCHCGACRRTVGALMVDWVNIPSKDIILTSKGPVGKYRASNHASREFCQTCGTSLFFVDEDDPDIVTVSVGSITTPNVFDFVEFGGHIWLEDTMTLVLDEGGKGGGLAGIINDGLPRTVRESHSQPFGV